MGPFQIGLLAGVEVPGRQLAKDDVQVVGRSQDAVADDGGARRNEGNSRGSRL